MLRSDASEPDTLVPVGPLSEFSAVTGRLIAVGADCAGNDVALVRDGGGCLWIVPRGGDATRLGAVNDVACALAIAAGVFVLMIPGEGPMVVEQDVDGAPWRVTQLFGSSGSWHRLPGVRFAWSGKREFTATSETLTLEGKYTRWHGPVARADLERMSAGIASVYRDLEAQARAAGVFVQPLLAWWRVVDADGRVLRQGAPVCVAPYGVQGTDALPAEVGYSGGRFCEYRGVKMSLYGFGMEATLCRHDTDGEEWSRVMRPEAVEVYVAPVDGLVDVSDGARASMTFTGESTDHGTMTLALPATTDRRGRVGRMLDALEANSYLAARFPADAPDGTSASIRPHDSAPVRPARATAWRPFTAGCGCAVADMAVWGDISEFLTPPPRPVEMAVAPASYPGQWTAMTRQTDASGRELTCQAAGQNGAPSALGPLAVCEGSDIRRLSIIVTTEADGRRRADFDLLPTPGGRWTMALDDDFTAAVLAASEVPAASATTPVVVARRMTDVVSASIAAPLFVSAAMALGTRRVVAVTAAARTSSAWDFARRHLYAFTPGGIYSLAVNASRTLASAHLIDSRGVPSGALVAAGAECVYAVADGGHTLLRVAGSKAEPVARFGVRMGMAAFCAATAEVWLASEDGSEAWIVERSGRVYRRDDVEPRSAMAGDGGLMLVACDDGILEASAETVSETPVAVSWSLTKRIPTAAPAVAAELVWPLSASEGDFTARLRGANSVVFPWALLGGVRCSGGYAAPVRLTFPPVRPYRWLRLELEGTVGSDMRLTDAVLTVYVKNIR